MSDDSKSKGVMIIGHVDHGKHMLTAALLHIAARRPELLVVDGTADAVSKVGFEQVTMELKTREVAPSPCYDDGNKRTYRGHIKKSEHWR